MLGLWKDGDIRTLRTRGRARQDVLPWWRRRFAQVFRLGRRLEGPKGLRANSFMRPVQQVYDVLLVATQSASGICEFGSCRTGSVVHLGGLRRQNGEDASQTVHLRVCRRWRGWLHNVPDRAACMWIANAPHESDAEPAPRTPKVCTCRRRPRTNGDAVGHGFDKRLSRAPCITFSATATTLAQHHDLVRHCLSAKRDLVTPRFISITMPTGVWPDVTCAHRLQVFDAPVDAGHWKLLNKREEM